MQADVLMLGVGLLEREPVERQDAYIRETVDALNPKLIIPIHWDDFTRKLDRYGSNILVPTPMSWIHDVKASLKSVTSRAKGRPVRLMNRYDSFVLVDGQVHTTPDSPAQESANPYYKGLTSKL
jgi:hypothetical protein